MRNALNQYCTRASNEMGRGHQDTRRHFEEESVLLQNQVFFLGHELQKQPS